MNCLKQLEVQELNAQEIRQIKGGFMITLGVCLFVLGMAIGLGIISGKPG